MTGLHLWPASGNRQEYAVTNWGVAWLRLSREDRPRGACAGLGGIWGGPYEQPVPGNRRCDLLGGAIGVQTWTFSAETSGDMGTGPARGARGAVVAATGPPWTGSLISRADVARRQPPVTRSEPVTVSSSQKQGSSCLRLPNPRSAFVESEHSGSAFCGRW